MIQPKSCGSVRNDEYSNYAWDLMRALESTSLASSKTPATFIGSMRPKN